MSPRKRLKTDDVVDPFHRLSDELALKILYYLTQTDVALRVSLVSRRFRRLSLDPSLWKRVSLPARDRLGTEQAKQVLRRCTMLRELDLTWKGRSLRGDEAALVIFALTHCHLPATDRNSLHGLRLAMLIPEVSRIIKREGKALRSLATILYSVPDGNRGTPKRNPDFLDNLTHLNLGFVFDEDLRTIADRCKALQEFSSTLNYFSIGAVGYFLRAVKHSIRKLSGFHSFPENALGECLLLESLSFSLDIESPTLLNSIASLPNLTNLDMKSALELATGDYVLAFSGGDSFPSLTSLSVNRCRGFNDVVLQVIALYHPDLTRLSLTSTFCDVTDVGFNVVIEKCAKLQTLELVHLVGVTLEHLAANPELLPKLERLNVKYCSNVTKRVVRRLGRAMPNCQILS